MIALVAAAIIAAAIPSTDAVWRFAVMAVVVGVFAAISLDQIALAGVAVLAWLIYNGFLEDRFGELAWHGSGDLWRVLLLVTVSAWGLALGEGMRFAAKVRARGVPGFDRVHSHGPGSATDLASAADVAGWSGPRPFDILLTDAGRSEIRCLPSSGGAPRDAMPMNETFATLWPAVARPSQDIPTRRPVKAKRADPAGSIPQVCESARRADQRRL